MGKKNKVNVVYSTNPNFNYSYEENIEQDTLPNNEQELRVFMEKAGRGGKTVTVVKGFVGTNDDLKELEKSLKQSIGTGGSSKDGEIIIQGDKKPKILETLKKMGYTRSK